MMGNYSVYPFVQELGLPLSAVRRVTSWNETLAEALAEVTGLKIHFISRYSGRTTRTLQRGGLTVTYLGGHKWLTAATLFRSCGWKARRLAEAWGADLVHGIGTEHIWPWAALGCDKPSVITIHGVVQEIAYRTGSPKLSLMSYFAWLEQRVLRQAREVIVINPWVKEWLQGRSNASAHLVENPVSAHFFAKSAMPAQSRTILFVGHTATGKGLGTLVEAFGLLRSQGKLSGWRIMVCGPVNESEYHQRTRSLIRQFGLSSATDFCGFVLPEALAKAYTGAAVLVLPSAQETAPMCVAEAMAVGLPVIATRVGGIPYMIEDGVTGFLFEHRDVQRLCTLLETCAGDPETRGRMGQAARSRAFQHWNPVEVARRTAEVYHTIAESQLS
jgi:glycosyltransferase involved in cell wall biosynthesis